MYKNYLITISLFLLTWLLLSLGYFTYSWQDYSLGSQRMFEYQLGKIDEIEQPEIVFLGDSSLGNAIDAEHFSNLTGRHTVNLALNGFYGFSGPYNLLRNLIDQQKVPKVVVVMNTAEMLSRDIAWQGYVLTSTDLVGAFQEFPSEAIDATGRLFLNSLNRNSFVKFLSFENTQNWQKNRLINDYSVQAKRRYKYSAETHIDLAANPQKLLFLNKIISLCESHSIEFVYLHGPMNVELANSLKNEVAVLNADIAENHINHSPILTTVSNEQTGDEFDHVANHAKQAVTRKYVELLTAIEIL
jgi:hypothetical protein